MHRRALIGMSLALLLTAVAHAETFNFTISSDGKTGSGTISGNVDPYNPNAFDITSGSGTFGSDTISLVTPSGDTATTQSYSVNPGDPNPYTYNNVLYMTGPQLDDNGLLFLVSGGPDVLNIYNSGGYFTSEGGTSTYNAVFSADFGTNATPEPGTMALLGTALLSGAGLVRRRLRV